MKKIKKLIILVGAPCSGKSTYIDKKLTKTKEEKLTTHIISRDILRKILSLMLNKEILRSMGSRKKEKIITVMEDEDIKRSLLGDYPIETIIIDNTNCKTSYIQRFIDAYKDHVDKIEIHYLDRPLYKLYFRNILRYITKKIWIPKEVIKNMHDRAKKIDFKDLCKFDNITFKRV